MIFLHKDIGGGGLVQPIFKFNGGGGVNLNLLAPTNNILGYEGGSYVENPGEVSGPGGIDKVPAMLTDGEFVMSRGAVQKYGVAELESMNAAGGGHQQTQDHERYGICRWWWRNWRLF